MSDLLHDESHMARRALALLDLTDLSTTCTEAKVEQLCARAIGPYGTVAAVCIWPQFIPLAKQLLRASPVKIATVANFPLGGTNTTRICDDVMEALDDGADEIDLVMPWQTFLDGEPDYAEEMIENVRDRMPQGHILKVILETGAYPTSTSIAQATRLAIDAGADFIKTSTGTTDVSATLTAASSILNVIYGADRPIGIKPSGGIRTLENAADYLALADEVMGADWATSATFRFGASGLYDVLTAKLGGADLSKFGKKNSY